jgi:hypothetical protein
MQASKTENGLRDFGIVEGRTGAHAVPRQQQFERDRSIDPVP